MNLPQDNPPVGRAISRANKRWLTVLSGFGLAVVLMLDTALSVRADLVIPGANGSDGALTITANTVIDLSKAVTGTWDADNTANAGKGVYDPQKWAVVFKYSSVTVAAGASVSFANHPSRAPVVWLVDGDVTIHGTVSLDGWGWVGAPGLAEPGPGGFRAGTSTYTSGVGNSAGFGIGGGQRAMGGSHGSLGGGGLVVYGNPSLLPLVGGSGGGGAYTSGRVGGGAGGGAMLVACAKRVSLAGVLKANGAATDTALGFDRENGGGSGGGIRIVASALAGGGHIRALGGDASRSGGLGRIRLERASYSGSLTITPDPSIVNLADGATALIWPPDNAPTLRVVSIGGVTAPEDPRAEFGATGADVALPQTSTVQVVIETTHVEEASQVRVRRTPRSNGEYTSVTATKDAVLGTDPLRIRWVASVPVATGYSALQVHVVRP